MSALVKKYMTNNEYTFVEIGDQVMYLSEVGYETFATVVEIHSTECGEFFEERLLVKFEDDDDGVDKTLVMMKAVNGYSENEMTEAQFEQALIKCKFSRENSKFPGHVRTTLADGTDVHFLPVSYIDDTDEENSSYSAILRDLLSAREWENQQL